MIDVNIHRPACGFAKGFEDIARQCRVDAIAQDTLERLHLGIFKIRSMNGAGHEDDHALGRVQHSGFAQLCFKCGHHQSRRRSIHAVIAVHIVLEIFRQAEAGQRRIERDLRGDALGQVAQLLFDLLLCPAFGDCVADALQGLQLGGQFYIKAQGKDTIVAQCSQCRKIFGCDSGRSGLKFFIVRYAAF